jgi:DNA transformation protein
MKAKKSNDLKYARNIGPTIEQHLNDIGVYSLRDLIKLTPVKAYEKICQRNPGKKFPVCYYLYSLQGAIMDLHWNDLPEEIKRNLKKHIT